MKNVLKNLLKKTKKELGGAPDLNFEVNYPLNEDHGDYASNLALVLGKSLKRKPREVAEEIVKELEREKEFKDKFKVEIAGPGFLNFWVRQKYLLAALKKVIDKREDFGKTSLLRGQKIMVEYAQPNPFKSFHIGHLRNIVIGEAVARVLESAGAEVVRTNYQGDVGLHVAKCFWGMKKRPEIAARKLKTFDEKVNYLADCYVLGTKAYEEDTKAKKEINGINKKIYELEKAENLKLKKEWGKKRQWSLDKFGEIYKRLGVKFDRLYFESEMGKDGLRRCEEAKERGILEEDDGCLIFDGEKHGLNKRVFRNKLGLPTYEAKELGLAFKEFKDFGNLDRAIHVVGNEQINFFKITFLVEKLLDEKLFDEKQFHLSYGFVSLKKGKMSSREGNVILAEDIINEAVERVMELLRERKDEKIKRGERDEVAEAVAIGAVKYSFLKIGTMKDIAFDLEESVQMEGRSGPYIMYGFVRAKNVIKRLSKEGWTAKGLALDDLGKIKLRKEERKLAFEILKLPEVLRQAAKIYQLAPITEYAYDLTTAFSNFYDKCSVLKEKDKKLKDFRLSLVKVFGAALGKCLWVLGIERMEKM